MTRPHALLVLLTALMFSPVFASPSITYPAGKGPGAGRHLVFLTGDEEYRGEEGLPMLAKLLSQRHGFRCTVLFPLDPDGTINPDNNASLGDSEQLATADGLVMMLRFRQWPDSVMRLFAAAVARGVPIIALRTSTHAFRFPDGHPTSFRSFNTFGREVLGEGWVSHWGPNRKGATLTSVEPGADKEELLRGVGPIFGDSGVYEVHPVTDARILLRGQVLTGMKPSDPPDTYRKKRKADGIEQGINDPAMPVAWTRVHVPPAGAGNRVFCTTLGAATDLVDEDLRRLVVNAIYWGFRLEVPAQADVRVVDAFSPTDYTFKGYRRGLRPEDHALGQPLPASRAAPPPAAAPAKE